MFNLLHNLHFIFNLLIQDTVLDKTPLLELLRSIRLPIILGSHFVHDGESTLAD